MVTRLSPEVAVAFGPVTRFRQLFDVIWRSTRRATVFVVGVALVCVGLVMFVTPGPGIVLVVAGLAVLATEFAWAEHLLDKAKVQASSAASKIPGSDRVKALAARLPFRRGKADAQAQAEATVASVAEGEGAGGGVAGDVVADADASRPQA
jgi:uncharacterized protein (TIGR02611 family)